MRNAVLVAMAVMCSSCSFARVVLPPAPPESAPEAERQQALLDLSPVGKRDGIAVYGSAYGPVAAEISTEFMMLGNGLRVRDPRDLLPVVPANSQTANYALEWASHAKTAGVTITVGLLSLVAGLSLTGVAASNGGSNAFWPILGTAGVSLLVSIVTMLWSIGESGAAKSARESAFLIYPNDLKRQLGFPHGLPSANSPPPLPPSAAPTSRCSAVEMGQMQKGGMSAAAIERACAP